MSSYSIEYIIYLGLMDKPEDLIAFLALVTSIVSIVYTAKSLNAQKIHNRKSVKPIGQIILGDYEDNLYVRIDNNGTGPLIITDVQILQSDQTLGNTLIGIIPEEISNFIPWNEFVEFLEQRAILPGDKLCLIEAKRNLEHQTPGQITFEESKWSELQKFLGELTITISYTDIYNSQPQIVSRKLNWFKRNFVATLAEMLN